METVNSKKTNRGGSRIIVEGSLIAFLQQLRKEISATNEHRIDTDKTGNN
jgi:hypothetical protein